jgi:hypothetical protein
MVSAVGPRINARQILEPRIERRSQQSMWMDAHRPSSILTNPCEGLRQVVSQRIIAIAMPAHIERRRAQTEDKEKRE